VNQRKPGGEYLTEARLVPSDNAVRETHGNAHKHAEVHQTHAHVNHADRQKTYTLALYTHHLVERDAERAEFIRLDESAFQEKKPGTGDLWEHEQSLKKPGPEQPAGNKLPTWVKDAIAELDKDDAYALKQNSLTKQFGAGPGGGGNFAGGFAAEPEPEPSSELQLYSESGHWRPGALSSVLSSVQESGSPLSATSAECVGATSAGDAFIACHIHITLEGDDGGRQTHAECDVDPAGAGSVRELTLTCPDLGDLRNVTLELRPGILVPKQKPTETGTEIVRYRYSAHGVAQDAAQEPQQLLHVRRLDGSVLLVSAEGWNPQMLVKKLKGIRCHLLTHDGKISSDAQVGVCRGEDHLVYDGKLLKEDQTLSSQGVHAGSMLQVLPDWSACRWKLDKLVVTCLQNDSNKGDHAAASAHTTDSSQWHFVPPAVLKQQFLDGYSELTLDEQYKTKKGNLIQQLDEAEVNDEKALDQWKHTTQEHENKLVALWSHEPEDNTRWLGWIPDDLKALRAERAKKKLLEKRKTNLEDMKQEVEAQIQQSGEDIKEKEEAVKDDSNSITKRLEERELKPSLYIDIPNIPDGGVMLTIDGLTVGGMQQPAAIGGIILQQVVDQFIELFEKRRQADMDAMRRAPRGPEGPTPAQLEAANQIKELAKQLTAEANRTKDDEDPANSQPDINWGQVNETAQQATKLAKQQQPSLEGCCKKSMDSLLALLCCTPCKKCCKTCCKPPITLVPVDAEREARDWEDRVGEEGRNLAQQEAKEQAQRLRKELQVMPPSALKARAKKDNVDKKDLDAADDADDVKATIIDLIVDKKKKKDDEEAALSPPIVGWTGEHWQEDLELELSGQGRNHPVLKRVDPGAYRVGRGYGSRYRARKYTALEDVPVYGSNDFRNPKGNVSKGEVIFVVPVQVRSSVFEFNTYDDVRVSAGHMEHEWEHSKNRDVWVRVDDNEKFGPDSWIKVVTARTICGYFQRCRKPKRLMDSDGRKAIYLSIYLIYPSIYLSNLSISVSETACICHCGAMENRRDDYTLQISQGWRH
jgi:hypothetical protein